MLLGSLELPTPTSVKVSGLTAFLALPVFLFPAQEHMWCRREDSNLQAPYEALRSERSVSANSTTAA